MAIVLKEDQGTGKRTIGEIAAILTPSAEHHRGIKVRLKDGQVGRVQEILPKAAPPPQAPTEVFLGILLVRASSGRWYFRSHKEAGSDETISLGLDFPLTRNEFSMAELSAASRAKLAKLIPESSVPPRLALQLSFDLVRPRLSMQVYFCDCSSVIDPEAASWSRSGWLSGLEIVECLQKGRLSPESHSIAETLRDQGLLD